MNQSVNASLTGLLFLFLSVFTLVSVSFANTNSYNFPSTIEPDAHYLFFLHNYYVEMNGPQKDCKYYDILNAFTDKDYTVISELRPPNAPINEYANKTANDVKTLLSAGVPDENIIVSGHSKGAVIVLQVASILNKPKIKYIIMAGCGIKGLSRFYPDNKSIEGNHLSLYSSSDKVAGSCSSYFTPSKQSITGKEIVLHSPLGHRLFFKPTDEWLTPIFNWLNHQ